MLTQETLQKMNAMKLFGMVSALEHQLSSNEYHELGFEERVGILVGGGPAPGINGVIGAAAIEAINPTCHSSKPSPPSTIDVRR